MVASARCFRNRVAARFQAGKPTLFSLSAIVPETLVAGTISFNDHLMAKYPGQRHTYIATSAY